MPPAKVKIERIDGHRMRQNTFHKRKHGLIKKAIELTILCDCDCAIILRPSASAEKASLSARDGPLVAYSNVNIQRMMQECWPDIMTQPQITNAEYAKLSKDEEAVNSVTASTATAAAAERTKSQSSSCAPSAQMQKPAGAYEQQAMTIGHSINPSQLSFLTDPRQRDDPDGLKAAAMQGQMGQQQFNSIANFMQWESAQSSQLLQGFNHPQVFQHQAMQGPGHGMVKGALNPAWALGARGPMPDLTSVDGALNAPFGMAGKMLFPGQQQGMVQFSNPPTSMGQTTGQGGAATQSSNCSGGNQGGDGKDQQQWGYSGQQQQQGPDGQDQKQVKSMFFQPIRGVP